MCFDRSISGVRIQARSGRGSKNLGAPGRISLFADVRNFYKFSSAFKTTIHNVYMWHINAVRNRAIEYFLQNRKNPTEPIRQ